MPSETSFADLHRHVMINCGRKAMVVNVPATSPIIVIVSILTPTRMLKKVLSFVLASLKASTYARVRLGFSLAAAALDDLFEHPAKLRKSVYRVNAPCTISHYKQTYSRVMRPEVKGSSKTC
jgi:hypothetical protein